MTTTGPIAAARADLADLLTRITSIPVVTSIPERLAPPCVVITEGTPLCAADENAHGSVTVRLSITVAVAPTTNALSITRLDEAVDTIVVGMVREGMFAAVDAYQSIKGADGQAYLAATITTTLTYTIEKDQS
nr:MAG TPA: hypothetical protein [Caudoviricetes sp.]